MKLIFISYKYLGRIKLYRWFAYKIINMFEGGEFYSKTLRKIFNEYHNIDIGMYTHGGCFDYGAFDDGTTIGRYCSISRPSRGINRDHPMEFLSTHALFFNPKLKVVKKDLSVYSPLKIGNDVWMGHNSIILSHVNIIGDGAVIGAGAVVNKDVPPYAVVVGNPARIVRYRFGKEVIEKLLESKWWDKSIDEIMPDLKMFTEKYSEITK